MRTSGSKQQIIYASRFLFEEYRRKGLLGFGWVKANAVTDGVLFVLPDVPAEHPEERGIRYVGDSR